MGPLPFFPYPYSVEGERFDGSVRAWPEVCERCVHRNCENGKLGELRVCSYGLNYKRINDRAIVAGIVLRDAPTSTPARNRQAKRLGTVPNREFDGAVESIAMDRQAREDAILDEEQFREDYLIKLKDEIRRGLAFAHDYKQINAQIAQNINVVIETRYEGENLEDKLEQASRAERAIYEAARFLTEKLNVAKFLQRPEWLTIKDECSWFRVHGMVLKYVKIYQSFFEQKCIEVKVTGQSYKTIHANGEACGVIVHTFLDNALKYSPRHAAVKVDVNDQKEGVVFSVGSYGPVIGPEEGSAIFRPFVRGEAARHLVEEGAGYGLYVSQLIAERHLGVEISVSQDTDDEREGRYWTTFTVEFPNEARILLT